VTRIRAPATKDEDDENTVVFFGHLRLQLSPIDPVFKTKALAFCAHVYDGVTLSPGSSQLSPGQLQSIFKKCGMTDDAAIFSTESFPDWFSIEVPGVPGAMAFT
jgi:hypothetical protein